MERNDFLTLAQFERLKAIMTGMERNDINPPPVKFPDPGSLENGQTETLGIIMHIFVTLLGKL